VAEGVYDAELDHLVGQKAQAPFRAALRVLRASKTDELCLFFPIKFAFVLPVWIFAFDRPLKPAFTKTFADAGNAPGGKLERLGDSTVGPRRSFRSLVGLQQNASTRLLLSRSLSAPRPLKQACALGRT